MKGYAVGLGVAVRLRDRYRGAVRLGYILTAGLKRIP
jgi:hypothetical protein